MSTCTASRKGGRGQCQANAVAGTNVCRVHGGNAPQVRRRAAQRLLEASDAAAAYLVKVVEDESKPDAIRLAAARDLLDRAGLSAKQSVELEIGPAKALAPWEELIASGEIFVGHAPEAAAAPRELTATVVPPADSQAAHDIANASRRSSDPMPPDWVSRQDGPRPRKGRKR